MTKIVEIPIGSSDGIVRTVKVNKSDLKLISKYRWRAHKWLRDTFYAQAWIRINGKKTTIMMHRLIKQVHGNKKVIVDHVNGDGLDNTRKNLRLCSNTQNCWNQSIAKNNTTGFRGVNRRANGYIARIRVNGELIHLKWTKDIKIAVQAYNEAAMKYYGEFARLNVI